MSSVLLTGSSHHWMSSIATANTLAAAVSMPIVGNYSDNRCFRSSFWNWDEKRKRPKFTPTLTRAHKKRRLSFSAKASSALATTRNSFHPNFYQEMIEAARAKFTQEISFQSKDKDISLAKALLYVAAEDEAFMAFNRAIDACSRQSERRDASFLSNAQEWDSMDVMALDEKSINEWLNELDAIAKEVEAELVSRDIGCHLVEVLEAVNLVLFESRGFKRPPVLIDPKFSYLHSVLSSGCGSEDVQCHLTNCFLMAAILLSVIYIEVCRRLNLTIVGSRVGEEFLIWPQTGNPEELFKVTSGHSLFGLVNGRCVDDPKSMASDLSSNSLSGLDIATNRDIIGIALANLVRLHWKCASRTNHGLMLTSPLRLVHDPNDKFGKIKGPNIPLVRPQDLRLAIMASERLLILQPHNWAWRRDHGMMLYYSREYEAAVQELSICMAFAPEEEAEILEPFVEKLHLLRLESSWKSLGGIKVC
ncbi:GPI-anchored protein like [Actinidia chinensis var. chinensis]|uniref:GPI-anchored protein like n=1 Tax=Actinidia chinensis var. chinensis TaxID=1590841 RepID=A0A2R6Q349_ACTCC|nr:GPI-anchored protein like [Actinidia chinensis var. chinensis]